MGVYMGAQHACQRSVLVPPSMRDVAASKDLIGSQGLEQLSHAQWELAETLHTDGKTVLNIFVIILSRFIKLAHRG